MGGSEPSMWGRLATCAAVGYRRQSPANAEVGRLPIGRRLTTCPTNSPQYLFPHRDAPNEIEIDGVAEAGFVAHRDGAVRGGFDGGLDDVLFPVAFASGNVARQHEIRQAGQGDIVGAEWGPASVTASSDMTGRMRAASSPLRNPGGPAPPIRATRNFKRTNWPARNGTVRAG